MKVGERLGRFELVRSLGKGSHGVVFEARDTMLGERVAIKALHPWLSNDETLRERFKRELILTRRINHAAVCRLYDLHEEGETLFISMQFVEGRTLSQVIKTESVDDARCVALIRGICGPLAAAHDAGVTHRDLKPGNVLVGENDRVVVLDFGIATAAGVGRLTTPGQALGSVPFIPPEVWDGGAASALGDQYALGVIAFATLTRELPFTGRNPMEIVDAIRTTKPSLRARAPAVGEALEAVILRAIAVKPEERYASILALDEALAAALQTPSSSLLPQTLATQTLASLAPSALPPSSPTPGTAPDAAREDDVEPLTSPSSIIELSPSMSPSSPSPGPGPLPPSPDATPGPGRVTNPSSIHEQVTLPMRRSELGLAADRTVPLSPPVGESSAAQEPVAAAPSDGGTQPRSDGALAVSFSADGETNAAPAADDLLQSFLAAEGFDDDPGSSPPASPPPASPPPASPPPASPPPAPPPPASPPPASPPTVSPPTVSPPTVSPPTVRTGVLSSADAPVGAPAAPATPGVERAGGTRRTDVTTVVRVRDVDADIAAVGAMARRERHRLLAVAAVGLVVVVVLGVRLVDGGAVSTAVDGGSEPVGPAAVAPAAPLRVDGDVVAAPNVDAGAPSLAGGDAGSVGTPAGVIAAAPGEEAAAADAGVLVIDEFVAASTGLGSRPASAVSPKPAATDPTGPDAATLSAWRLVQAQAQARGLRGGDAPAFDTAASRAQAAIRGRSRATAAAAVAAARTALDAVVVDRAFVSEKLARFNRAFDGKDPALQEQLKPLTKDVLGKIGKKDWAGANATLNDGFARLAKGR